MFPINSSKWFVECFVLMVLIAVSCYGNPKHDLIATCLIREAGSHGECMTSVMHVIANRAKEDNLNSFYAVINKPYQFESIHGKDKQSIIARAKRHPRWAEAYRLVTLATLNRLPTTQVSLGKPTHFFNPSIVQPRWAKSMKYVGKIGGHVFYRE